MHGSTAYMPAAPQTPESVNPPSSFQLPLTPSGLVLHHRRARWAHLLCPYRPIQLNLLRAPQLHLRMATRRRRLRRSLP